VKNFLLAIVFLCVITIGVLIKNYYFKRQRFYISFSKFCENLIINILNNSDKLEKIILSNISYFESDFSLLLNIYLDYLKNLINEDKFKEQTNKLLNFLKKNEKEDVINFFLLLGNQTQDEEILKIRNFVNNLANLKQECIEKNKKFANLYFKLFLIFGLMIVIIFI